MECRGYPLHSSQWDAPFLGQD
ncbi:unnamed protein product [Linum tenue]|uniref:Uncharacterized protein n=1 Tax=Linum tenue TaxID=586396 RepID=A0AAV0J481_9ROSI|nr:unnamed protein product [Linum tenue]